MEVLANILCVYVHYNVYEEPASTGNIRTEFKNAETLPLAMTFSKGRQRVHRERESSVSEGQ